MQPVTPRKRLMRPLALGIAAILMLSGCGLVALPFRVVGDVVQVVPVVGGVVGKPVHAVGDVID